jgi:FSR family fosmidomycin resistance protein-like MFS transporter
MLQAAGVAGAMVGGWVSDRVGRRAVVLTGFLGASACLVALVLASGWVRVPVLLVLGFTLLAIQPVNMALAQEAAPQSRALANGVFLAMSFTIRTIAVVAFGVIADGLGLRWAFLIAAMVMVAGIPLALAVPSGAGWGALRHGLGDRAGVERDPE